jgi:protein-histidine pros-kinase
MPTSLVDPTLVGTSEALDFLDNILQASTEYSIIAGNLDGQIQLWNEGARRLYGYDSQEVIGKVSWAILCAPEEVAAGRPAEILAAALRDGRWQGLVFRVSKNGRRFPARMVVTPRRGADGRPIGFLLISKDVTEELQTAHAEERFHGLLEAAPDALLLVNEAGEIVLVNSQAERTFGYRRDKILGRPVEMLVPQRFRAHHPAHRIGYFHAPRVRPMGGGLGLFGLHEDGSEFPVEISLSPLTSGAKRFVICAVRDVTERKKAEAIRAMLESAPEAMVIVNQAGSIVLVNSQTESLFGYPRHELHGQPVEMLVPERFRDQHPSYRDDFFREPRVRAIREGMGLFGRRKDGSEFPVEINLSPLETSEGVLAISSIHDISERKRFERALREKNIELENASQAKDLFLATMSHELRTPLNAIIGFTGTLLMKLPGPLNVAQEKQLGTVQSSAKHLLSLINDLLDLAKIESGKVELHAEPVACREVVQEVAASLRPQAEAKGLSLDVSVAPPDLVVRADRRALSQILLNLTSNGIRFTEQGGVRLDVRRLEEGVQFLTEFAVADTGVGIQEADQAKLFQAFTQVGAPRKRRFEGTGLGLHLSQKLAELLGGRITFHSEFGRGSTFTLTLVGDRS